MLSDVTTNTLAHGRVFLTLYTAILGPNIPSLEIQFRSEKKLEQSNICYAAPKYAMSAVLTIQKFREKVVYVTSTAFSPLFAYRLVSRIPHSVEPWRPVLLQVRWAGKLACFLRSITRGSCCNYIPIRVKAWDK